MLPDAMVFMAFGANPVGNVVLLPQHSVVGCGGGGEEKLPISASFQSVLVGLEVRKPGGSHAIFFHVGTGKQISVPAKRPIKPFYIGAFINLLDEIGVEHEED